MLAKGEIQAKVNESGVKRHLDVARRKENLLGTNQYPNFSEKALDKIQEEGCCKCGCHAGEAQDGAVESLNFDRAASQFEQLRLDTERSAHRPKVFMLTIGNLAMRLARAQFSSNFFGCAGRYELRSHPFFTDRRLLTFSGKGLCYIYFFKIRSHDYLRSLALNPISVSSTFTLT